MALWAQGQWGFDGVTGSGMSRGRRRCGLRVDDGTAGPGTARVNGVVGSGMAHDAQCREIGEENVVAGLRMASRALGWCRHGRRCHRLGSGSWRRVKGPR
jgi:hypothetical protein